MPDILTGEEEQRLTETITDFNKAIERLDPIDDAVTIQDIRIKIVMLQQTIDEEVPTPRLCNCNPPDLLPSNKCEFGHVLGKDGLALNPPEYLPLGLS